MLMPRWILVLMLCKPLYFYTIKKSLFFVGLLAKLNNTFPWETQQYFSTFVDGRGGKPSAILAEVLTLEDSRLKPVTSSEPRECTHVLPIELTLGACYSYIYLYG